MNQINRFDWNRIARAARGASWTRTSRLLARSSRWGGALLLCAATALAFAAWPAYADTLPHATG